MPLFTAVVFLFNAFNITRLPDAAHDLRPPRSARSRIAGPGPMSNVGWLASSLLQRRAVDQPGHPQPRHPAVAGRQDRRPVGDARVPLRHQHRHVHRAAAGRRAGRQGRHDRPCGRSGISTLFFVVSCVITLSTHHTVGLLTIVLFFLGHVTLTGAELFLSAASWTFEAELMDPRRRGEYQGAAELDRHAGPGLGARRSHLPRDELGLGSAGWSSPRIIVRRQRSGCTRPTAMARRFLEQHVPADVLADARRARRPSPRRSARRRSSSRPSPAARARWTPATIRR